MFNKLKKAYRKACSLERPEEKLLHMEDLLDDLSELTVRDIAKLTRRDVGAVYAKLSRLGLKCKNYDGGAVGTELDK